ncbi:MAG: hypothetical protein WD887_00545 [Candidatus Saccharimonadales bacterium]
MVSLKLQNKIADGQLSNLETAKKEVQQYAYFKEVAKTVIPSEKDQAATVLEILQIASEAGISIQGITFPSSNLGGSSAGAQSDASTASPQNVISQSKAVSGIPGLYSIELTITPESGPQVPPTRQVTYPKMLRFLKGIENNRHTAQITQVNIQPLPDEGVNFTLKVHVFIKP